MIDIKLIRSSPKVVEDSTIKRGGRYLPYFKEVLEKDKLRLEKLREIESLNRRRNEIAQEIAKYKKENTEIPQSLIDEATSIKNKAAIVEDELTKIESEVEMLLLSIPNIVDESVPYGRSDQENKIIYEDLSKKRAFDFKPLSHWEIGERLGIIDFETASKLSGSRFALLKDKGAKLERALINFMLDLHTQQHGYIEIFPPFLVNRKTMTGTGQLPKFEDDLYKVLTQPELFLIPTAEVPLTNMYADMILNEEDLPKQFTAYTACFRQEAGSYGKDTKGLIRNHQFNKVELIWITTPEKSDETLEVMTMHARKVLEILELPYRVVQLCSGDLGFASAKTYDIEVWMPSENRFREISSCSNCKDFQARRMNTKFKRSNGKVEYVHTLNGSGLAVGRTFAAIIENYQNPDGSITIPKALVKYTGFDRI